MIPNIGRMASGSRGTVEGMPVRDPQTAYPEHLRWMMKPGWGTGIASVMNLAGILTYDRSRFRASADAICLEADGRLLMFEFKRAHAKARREPLQERLFEPDA